MKKVVMYLNFFFIYLKICGFTKVVCGFLLLSDSQRILLSSLLTMPEDGLPEPPFYYVALALLASGLTICFIATFGIWATYMPGYILLTIVSFCLFFLIIRHINIKKIKLCWFCLLVQTRLNFNFWSDHLFKRTN